MTETPEQTNPPLPTPPPPARRPRVVQPQAVPQPAPVREAVQPEPVVAPEPVVEEAVAETVPVEPPARPAPPVRQPVPVTEVPVVEEPAAELVELVEEDTVDEVAETPETIPEEAPLVTAPPQVAPPTRPAPPVRGAQPQATPQETPKPSPVQPAPVRPKVADLVREQQQDAQVAAQAAPVKPAPVPVRQAPARVAQPVAPVEDATPIEEELTPPGAEVAEVAEAPVTPPVRAAQAPPVRGAVAEKVTLTPNDVATVDAASLVAKKHVALPPELLEDDDDADDFIGLFNMAKKSKALAKHVKENPEVLTSSSSLSIADGQEVAALLDEKVAKVVAPDPLENPVIKALVDFHEELGDRLQKMAETFIVRDGLVAIRVPAQDDIVEVQFKNLPDKEDIGMRYKRYPKEETPPIQ